jgi:hypothetical protein
MAGATLERQLTGRPAGRVHFDTAVPADDADIRRLLRETPMAGQISISLEREPDYFADADVIGETKQTIIARDEGRLVCLGSCAIRQCFVNGKSHRVGYLGGLRLDNQYAGRFDILRRGYEFFRKIQIDAPADFYFTSIAADNERARKFLERGVTGMPSYEFISEYVTVLIPTSHHRSEPDADWSVSQLDHDTSTVEDLVAFLNNSNKQRQFAPCWSASELGGLEPVGLRASDFRMVRQNERITLCGALWEQRGFKQTVIRDYAPWLKFALPAMNGVNRLLNNPQMPAIGETLANAFASPLAFASEGKAEFLKFIEVLQHDAQRRQIEYLTLGFAANDPHLAMVQKAFPSREYRSRLYVVRWPGIGRSATELDGRMVAPEVALL